MHLDTVDQQLLMKSSVIVLHKSDFAADSGLALTEFMARKTVADSLAVLPASTRVMLTSATQKLGVEELQDALDRMCLDELH